MSRLKNNGPNDQLTQLYRSYAEWLKRVVRKRFAAEDADDIVQETYLRISRLADENVVTHPRALLLRVATNTAIDRVRRAARGVTLATRLGATDEREFSVRSHQAEDLLFKQIIMTMPLAYRDVFILSRFSGLTYEEIALEIGLSVKTVEWRMSKALGHCQRMLRDE